MIMWLHPSDKGEYNLANIPKDLIKFLDRIIWGARYFVKINETWIVARGWKTKTGNLSVIFEPYKNEVIGYKAGDIYEINNRCDWEKVIGFKNDECLKEYVIRKNVNELRRKHPTANDSKRRRQENPFDDISQEEFQNMTAEEINRRMIEYIRSSRDRNDE